MCLEGSLVQSSLLDNMTKRYKQVHGENPCILQRAQCLSASPHRSAWCEDEDTGIQPLHLGGGLFIIIIIIIIFIISMTTGKLGYLND